MDNTVALQRIKEFEPDTNSTPDGGGDIKHITFKGTTLTLNAVLGLWIWMWHLLGEYQLLIDR